MKKYSNHIFIPLLTILLLFGACQQIPVTPSTQFMKLSAEQSGIDFINQLEFRQDFNIYTYRNFFNGGGVGIAENILTGNIKVQTLDGSYSDGSTYYLNVFNVGEPQVSVRFLDLTGRTLAMQCFQTESNEAHGQYSLASFPKGMVLASVEVNGKVINTKKIMVK